MPSILYWKKRKNYSIPKSVSFVWLGFIWDILYYKRFYIAIILIYSLILQITSVTCSNIKKQRRQKTVLQVLKCAVDHIEMFLLNRSLKIDIIYMQFGHFETPFLVSHHPLFVIICFLADRRIVTEFQFLSSWITF